MGLIAKIIDSFTGDDNGPAAKIEIYKNDNINSRIFLPPGVDARPLDGDIGFSQDSEDTEGGKDLSGFNDPKNKPISKKGELRIYSRNSDGETQAEIYLKAGGLMEIKNQVQALSALINELFTEIKAITTTGSPASHTISTATKQKFTDLNTKFDELFG